MLWGNLRAAALRVLLAVVLVLPIAARAHDYNHEGHRGHDRGSPWETPEFDPAAVGAIAAVLVGGGVLLARRRRS